MVCIGLALGFTIDKDVPNTFHGVVVPQPSLKVEVHISISVRNQSNLDK
jgi:hypothetical protein